MKITPRSIALLAILTTLALIPSLFDNLLSRAVPIPLPGFKIGIANLVSLFLVMYFSFPQTLCVVFMRCFLSSLYSGGVTVFLISLSGGVLSIIIMYLIKRLLCARVSAIGISISGAAAHNTGQVFMVMLLFGSPNYFYYLPILLVLSIFTGFIIGLVGMKMYPMVAQITHI